MNINQFQKMLAVIGIGGVILISILAWVGENRVPYLAEANVSGGTSHAEYVDQQIELVFNRPMQWSEAKVTTTPEVPFDLFWDVNSLFITFRQPLQPGEKYTIQLDQNIPDTFGTPLGTKIEVSFKTKERKLAYIGKSRAEDFIYLANDKLEVEKELYRADKIRAFDIYRDYLVAVVETNRYTDQLILKNLNDQTETVIEEGDIRVSNIDISQSAQQVLYIKQPVDVLEELSIPSGGHTMHLLDLTTKKTKELSPPFGSFDYSDVRFTDDGLGVVFRIEDGTYYLMDPDNPNTNVSLGRHLAMSNFSQNGDQLIMLDQPTDIVSFYPNVTLVKSNRSTERLFGGKEFIIDPTFLNTQAKVLFCELAEELPNTKGVFKLMIYDQQTKQKKELLRDKQKRSLELPVASADDKLVIVERYTKEDQSNLEDLRVMEFQTKPAEADLIIYNLETGKVIDPKVRGVGAVWVE